VSIRDRIKSSKLRALNRVFSHKINMSHLYREMHTQEFMTRSIRDNAILFWDYEDYLRNNIEIFTSYLTKHNVDKDRSRYLEFGVFRGYSINFISSILKDYQCVGFDSFEGFRSVKKSSFWSSYQASFSGQELPEVNSNVRLIKGYVENTLPEFLNTSVQGVEVFFVHCDMDIYEPARVLLDWIATSDKKFFLMFDELINYNEFHLHEYRAFLETIIEKKVPFRVRTMCDRGKDEFGALGKVFVEIR